MILIDQFLARYRKEFDFYSQVSRLGAQLIEQQLQSAGIRAIVTWRAKSLTRLAEKIRQRSESNNYRSVDDIFRDIVDLAGIRVALYFPGEGTQVDKVIRQLFVLESDPKVFPQEPKPEDKPKPEAAAHYSKRFSGYSATHYRVYLRESSMNEAEKRYASALIEIQVASVLMHAWAEVEHDLVYKPQQGALSYDEYSILDQINGLVVAGELALEQLQRVGKQRVAAQDRKFSNHYDLADYLLDRAGSLLRTADPEAQLGRINVLFKLLDALALATPNALGPYLAALDSDFERRPLADQIIDQLLAENDERYKTYEQVKGQEPLLKASLSSEVRSDEEATGKAIGRFMSRWIDFERRIRLRMGPQPTRPWLVPTTKVIADLGVLSQRSIAELDRIRRFRNNLVHGVEIPSSEEINSAADMLAAILGELGEY
jgi:ppGpp synthetase/RelA/SpoT-type nucleotidyltranferase